MLDVDTVTGEYRGLVAFSLVVCAFSVAAMCVACGGGGGSESSGALPSIVGGDSKPTPLPGLRQPLGKGRLPTNVNAAAGREDVSAFSGTTRVDATDITPLRVRAFEPSDADRVVETFYSVSDRGAIVGTRTQALFVTRG
jgi:hypothetical protein